MQIELAGRKISLANRAVVRIPVENAIGDDALDANPRSASNAQNAEPQQAHGSAAVAEKEKDLDQDRKQVSYDKRHPGLLDGR